METLTSRTEAEDDARQDECENTPEPPKALAAKVCREQKGSLLINLGNYDGGYASLTADYAANVLRAAGCPETKSIYIHDTMPAEFEADGRRVHG